MIPLFRKKKAISDLIGVIMLLAIMIALVAVFYTFFAEPGTENIDKIPIVVMRQNSDYVSIITVKNGHVPESVIILRCFDSDGGLVNATLNIQEADLSAGDTITFDDLSGYASGEEIEVKLSNSRSIIGTFNFEVP